MTDKTKYERLFDLYRRFMTHGRLTIPRMMEDYGINRRTANRDINDLRRLGVHLESTVTDNGLKTWFLPTSERQISVPFNITDLTALFMGRRLFDFLKGTLLEESMDKIYETIEACIEREKDWIRIRDLKRKVHIIHEGPKELTPIDVEQLDEILTGLLENRKVRFSYRRSSGSRTEVTLSPYTLVGYRRGLYLLGRPDSAAPLLPKLYAIERIRRATAIRGTSYRLPPDFHPEHYFSDALFLQRGTPVQVVLRFASGSAPFITMRKFHPSQKLETLPDKRLQMTLHIPADTDNFEIENWIMGFHRHVEVIAPLSLRNRIRHCLQNALSQYADTDKNG
jgi:predicted DNA-binding transcriptional regulator YafY